MMKEDFYDMKKSKKAIALIHKHTKDIQLAGLR